MHDSAIVQFAHPRWFGKTRSRVPTRVHRTNSCVPWERCRCCWSRGYRYVSEKSRRCRSTWARNKKEEGGGRRKRKRRRRKERRERGQVALVFHREIELGIVIRLIGNPQLKKKKRKKRRQKKWRNFIFWRLLNKPIIAQTKKYILHLHNEEISYLYNIIFIY